MNSGIKFSIITPCFNSGRTIERTLKSLASQNYENFEYIIIDGLSSDNTIQIIERYRGIFKDNMRVISEPDDGIYDAMNKGIAMATGEIVGIVNSDDFYENDCLRNVLHCYKRDEGEYQILYGGIRCLDKEGDTKAEVFYHHKYLESQMINHPATFVTKKLYDDFGVYDIKYKSSSDLDFMLRMKESGKVVFVPIHKILTNFTSGGISGTYIGAKETAMVRYRHGVISTKFYLFDCLKIWGKSLLKV